MASIINGLTAFHFRGCLVSPSQLYVYATPASLHPSLLGHLFQFPLIFGSRDRDVHGIAIYKWSHCTRDRDELYLLFCSFFLLSSHIFSGGNTLPWTSTLVHSAPASSSAIISFLELSIYSRLTWILWTLELSVADFGVHVNPRGKDCSTFKSIKW